MKRLLLPAGAALLLGACSRPGGALDGVDSALGRAAGAMKDLTRGDVFLPSSRERDPYGHDPGLPVADRREVWKAVTRTDLARERAALRVRLPLNPKYLVSEGLRTEAPEEQLTRKRIAERLSWNDRLVPLGPDPDSGLEEFAVVGSGTIGLRDPATGALPSDDTAAVVLVLLPGGSFPRGAQKDDPAGPNYDPEALPDEGPVTTAEVAPFLIAKYELTRGQAWAFGVSAHTEGVPDAPLARPRVPVLVGDLTAHPWLGRLSTPTTGLDLAAPSQWEFACRAGTTTPYSDSSPPATFAWTAETSGGDVHPVGLLAPNAFGLYDMHGNALESVGGKDAGRGGSARRPLSAARSACTIAIRLDEKRGDLDVGVRLAMLLPSEPPAKPSAVSADPPKESGPGEQSAPKPQDAPADKPLTYEQYLSLEVEARPPVTVDDLLARFGRPVKVQDRNGKRRRVDYRAHSLSGDVKTAEFYFDENEKLVKKELW